MITILLVFLTIALTGCSGKLMCSPPNVIIDDSCCLDADDNGLCDTWEESDDEPEVILEKDETVKKPEPMPDKYEEFAKTFASTWNRKSYTALHNLFVDDLNKKFSSQEFNFLARKLDSKEGILSVTLKQVKGDTATYTVDLGSSKIDVSADIDEQDAELKHEAFYIFLNLEANIACEGDDECFKSFAKISGDQNFCDKAGDLRRECIEMFGVRGDLSDKIDSCLEIGEIYDRADCLTDLAVGENDIEPCWNAVHDKQIFECMGVVAAARNAVDDCFEFASSKGFPATRLQEAYCIVQYVEETTDTTACSKIDRRGDVVLGAMQEACTKLDTD